MASAPFNNYTTWTPEQLMRDYHGEIKRELFLRCMEWYTNSEVEAKINAGRSDGTKIQNSNFYAEFKRNIEVVALHDGHLPTDYRLQFDKRRFINLEARFGSEHETVKALRKSVRRREAIGFPTLSARPSLQELEAARPDNGKNLQKGRETREYWHKFLAAATETYTTDHIRAVYGMASSTVQQEITRAKRIVARLGEIEQVESSGGSIPQTYHPAPLLLPGSQIYSSVSAPLRRQSLVVVLKVNISNMRNPSTTPSTRAPTPPLLSVRMKIVLSRLRHELEEYPRYPPTLASLASRFEPAIECLDETELDRQRFATCETAASLAGYQAWCEGKGVGITRQNSATRVSKCLVQIIRRWRDEVMEAENAGVGELEETFLHIVMRRLEDLDGVEREMEEEARECDFWARDVECG
ncbi:hypothetical protein MBLNU13_g04563t1 [Cladosporium sp. NU13]